VGLRLRNQQRPGPWEGELRNMWKPTHRPVYGSIAMASAEQILFKVLALQIRAREVGIRRPFISWPRCITRGK